MKSIKTSELVGPALDWAVAKCEGAYISKESDEPFWLEGAVGPCFLDKYSPSTNWSQAGPIIEREKISVYPSDVSNGWRAHAHVGCYALPKPKHTQDGPTPIIAAMRCYVTSKLGDTVEIPEELS